MILLVIKIILSTSLVNIENNKQIKLAKKSKQAACVSKFNQKNLTSPYQAHGHDTSSKVNEPPVNHLKSLGTQKYSLRVDGPR
jgi:hypothetical protein